MNRWRSSSAFKFGKRLLQATLFPSGSIRYVLWGPCRGMRYRIFSGYGNAFLYGGWERKCASIICQYVNPGDIVYDVGANYGMHTLLMARLVGPSGHVYAFEPNPAICSGLNEQLKLNNLKSVSTIAMAVSDRNGFGPFAASQQSATGHLTVASSSASEAVFNVPTLTLDRFVLEESNVPPCFVKIDVEGAESAALRGCLRLIERYRPLFLIELHNPTEDRAVGTILKKMRYVAFRVETGQRIENMESGWPDRSGMWGTVLAIPFDDRIKWLAAFNRRSQ